MEQLGIFIVIIYCEKKGGVYWRTFEKLFDVKTVRFCGKVLFVTHAVCDKKLFINKTARFIYKVVFKDNQRLSLKN